MSLTTRRTHRHSWIYRALAAALLLVLALTATLVSGRPSEKGDNKNEAAPRTPAEKAAPKTAPAAKQAAAVVEARCTDGSILNLTVLDERIELITPYGKLLIPVRDIERIEVAFRIPEAAARRIEAAVADLGKADFQHREAASAALLELRERAYPALLKAAKSADAEVARRARELLEKIRSEVPEERLQFRPHDIVYTEESKNTGRIASATLKVLTLQFGEQQLKLSDVLEVRSPSAAEPAVANAMPDPGNLSMFAGQVGTVYTFHVDPRVNVFGGGRMFGGGGAVWGSDVYTLDSSLALAAVHAGVLKPGQAGTVRVKITGPRAAFAGSTRNGVTSQPYGPFNGSFEFVKGRGRAHRR
ncbi:MAG TPA: LCCL domain-containing protein [Gemmataceae bacterium]|nr:LCCL domain-containing protein [Gemmataceae bacterium]